MFLANTPSQDDLSWLGPVVAVVGSIVVALIYLFAGLWQRRLNRRDALTDKKTDEQAAVQPKITDGWEEVRMARAEATFYYNLYRAFEDLYYTVLSALRHLVRSSRDARPDEKFDQDVVDALATVPPDTTPPDASK